MLRPQFSPRLSVGLGLITLSIVLASEVAIAQTTDNVNDVFDDTPQLIDPDRGINIGDLVEASRRLSGPTEARGARTETIDEEVLRYRNSQESRVGPNIFDDDSAEPSTDVELVEDTEEGDAIEGVEDGEITP